jgi:RND superfamily putative drug exporter
MTPDSAPQDEKTGELVDRLRADVVPAATAGGDAVAYVSGQTAAFKDIAERSWSGCRCSCSTSPA